MESSVKAAEAELALAQASLENPAIASDAAKLAKRIGGVQAPRGLR